VSAWLRAALAAQLAFFALWGGRLLTSHRDVATVWLATAPVDPRDLLSGHYVALRYPISDPEHTGCNLPIAGDVVYLRLEPSGDALAVPDDGEAQISEPVDCRLEPPDASGDEVWIAGRLDATSGRTRLVYGIERFYVPETSALREATTGSVVAKVAINDAGEPRLIDLVPAKREPPTAE
jgi:uncharacterized membrane-anchored protein